MWWSYDLLTFYGAYHFLWINFTGTMLHENTIRYNKHCSNLSLDMDLGRVQTLGLEQKQSSSLPELDRDGSEILLAPFLRDLLTHERDDVKDALGILYFPLFFTIECPKQRIPFHQPRQPFSHSEGSSLTDQYRSFL